MGRSSRLPKPLRWTYDDYCLLPEDGRRHEILGGEHVVSPAPRPVHQIVLTQLIVLLHTTKGFAGRLMPAPVDVVLSEHDVVQPDLVWLSAERLDRLTEKNLQGAPDLVVEILSPSTRRVDEKLKRRLYARHDVREYWLIDPDLFTVRIFGRADDSTDGPFRLVRELDAEEGDRLASALFPTLDVEVASLFD